MLVVMQQNDNEYFSANFIIYVNMNYLLQNYAPVLSN